MVGGKAPYQRRFRHRFHPAKPLLRNKRFDHLAAALRTRNPSFIRNLLSRDAAASGKEKGQSLPCYRVSRCVDKQSLVLEVNPRVCVVCGILPFNDDDDDDDDDRGGRRQRRASNSRGLDSGNAQTAVPGFHVLPNSRPALKPVQPFVNAALLVHAPVFVHDVDRRQVPAFSHFVIVRVVPGGHFQRALRM